MCASFSEFDLHSLQEDHPDYKRPILLAILPDCSTQWNKKYGLGVGLRRISEPLEVEGSDGNLKFIDLSLALPFTYSCLREVKNYASFTFQSSTGIQFY